MLDFVRIYTQTTTSKKLLISTIDIFQSFVWQRFDRWPQFEPLARLVVQRLSVIVSRSVKTIGGAEQQST
jgi:uncharacterized protein Usg